MKTMKIVSANVLALVVLLFLGTCASTKIPLPTNSIDELVGTWINTDYTVSAQKYVVEPDGVYVGYRKIENTTHNRTGTIELMEKWTDSKENIYYKIRVDKGGVWAFELHKLSNSGTVWEFVQSFQDYPSEIDPNDLNYRVYYRQ